MSDEQWKRLELLVDVRDTEDIGAALMNRGSLGVEVQDQFTFGASAVPDGKARIISFFDADRDEVSLPGFQIESMTWSDYDDVSWRESWKAFFKPTLVSRRLIVGPPWETFDAPEGGHKIVIEPGMAFGTGTHETTTLCAQQIDALFDDNPPETFFDIGCGSGNLSIAACKLGAGCVLGVDIEDDSVRISKENAVINEVHADFDQEWPGTKFEFVVANILAHILVSLRTEIFEHLHVEGTLIVSGITREQIDSFIVDFVPDDRTVRSRIDLGDWVALVIQ